MYRASEQSPYQRSGYDEKTSIRFSSLPGKSTGTSSCGSSIATATTCSSSSSTAVGKAQELLGKLHEKQELMILAAKARLDKLEAETLRECDYDAPSLQQQLMDARKEIEKLKRQSCEKDKELMEQSMKLFEAGRLEPTKTAELQDKLDEALRQIRQLKLDLGAERKRANELEQANFEAMKRELALNGRLEHVLCSKKVYVEKKDIDASENWTDIKNAVPSQVALDDSISEKSSGSLLSEFSNGEFESEVIKSTGFAKNVYEVTKEVWGTAKCVFLLTPFMGLAEGVANTAVGLAGSSLKDVDTHVSNQVNGLDNILVNPLVEAASWVVLGSVHHAKKGLVDPVVSTIVRPFRF